MSNANIVNVNIKLNVCNFILIINENQNCSDKKVISYEAKMKTKKSVENLNLYRNFKIKK